MRTLLFIFMCILTAAIGCTGDEPPSPPSDLGPELIHAIAEYDVEYQVRANSVAQDLMQHWPEESYIRWRPVRIEPRSFLSRSHMDDGAMPNTISITPFPDVTIVADVSDYMIIDANDDAIWKGQIRGADGGYVEVTIVGEVDNPSFSIRISSTRHSFNIFSTDVPEVYVAMEINPNCPQSMQ